MCVSAGLGPEGSLRLAAGSVRGPLARELERTLDLVGVGARWRDALGELAERCGSTELRRLGEAITQSETVGSSLGGALGELADESRAVRRAAGEARARAAPVKLLFPLALLILPAFLLLTVVPVVLATLRSL
jgi:tight adherence protein C